MGAEVRRILIVDDSPEDCSRAEQLLTSAVNWDWHFVKASSGEHGLVLARSGDPFDCVLIDYHLPDMEGTEFLERMRERPGDPGVAAVVITGMGDEFVAVQAMKSGAQEYVSKINLKPELLFRAVESAISHFEWSLSTRRSAEALAESEKRYRALADAMPQIVWTAGAEGHRDYFNRRWYDFFASSEDLSKDQSWTDVVHPDDVQAGRAAWQAAVRSGGAYEMQSRLRDRDSGAYRWYLVRALPQRDGGGSIVKWVGTATDIDDHKRLTEELESRVEDRTSELSRSLVEKTTLLKELHHRVKNNLQVICSLLSLQIDSTKSDFQSMPLKDAYSRVMAMSLVHQQIYQAENLAEIDFGGYIELLSGQLFNAYCIDQARVRLELNVDAVRLDLDEAVPCGLILNELLSNSLKHAFGDGREGTIRISLRKTEGEFVELEVADDGAGLPVGFRLEESPSLGLQVVCILTEQLQAELVVSGDSGTAFTLRLKVAEGRNSTS